MADARRPPASLGGDALRPVSRDWIRRVRRSLLSWYRRCGRDLPWRRSRDPYAVWVSEIMLQQTQLKTMVPYFERWMRRFPDVKALAAASEQEVILAWEGLGYYSRARALKESAARIVLEHAGRLPADVAELQRLPGIGPYSAGAIASIAYGLPVPAVDGNVSRVLCRLRAWTGSPARPPTKSHVWELARRLVADGRASELNQSIMDLGATVCTPRAPLCSRCPVRRCCQAAGLGLTAEIPRPVERPSSTRTHEVAGLVRRHGRWLLAQRAPDERRWTGLWVFPYAEARAREAPSATLQRALRAVGLTGSSGSPVMQLEYQVTRFRVALEVRACPNCTGRATPIDVAAVAWRRPDELEGLAMPAAHRKIAMRLARLRPRPRPSRGSR